MSPLPSLHKDIHQRLLRSSVLSEDIPFFLEILLISFLNLIESNLFLINWEKAELGFCSHGLIISI